MVQVHQSNTRVQDLGSRQGDQVVRVDVGDGGQAVPGSGPAVEQHPGEQRGEEARVV